MPTDPVTALRELVEAAERFSTEADYSVSVSTEEDFSAALDDAREALEALEGGERVTLWRWVDPEQPYDDHRGEWQTGSHPEPLDTDVELRTALLLPQENPQ